MRAVRCTNARCHGHNFDAFTHPHARAARSQPHIYSGRNCVFVLVCERTSVRRGCVQRVERPANAHSAELTFTDSHLAPRECDRGAGLRGAHVRGARAPPHGPNPRLHPTPPPPTKKTNRMQVTFCNECTETCIMCIMQFRSTHTYKHFRRHTYACVCTCTRGWMVAPYIHLGHAHARTQRERAARLECYVCVRVVVSKTNPETSQDLYYLNCTTEILVTFIYIVKNVCQWYITD